jgi:hypothetical protein
VTGSYGGLSPIFQFKGGPLDPVLESIAKRRSAETGKPFSEAQVLYLWQREKGAVIVTCVALEANHHVMGADSELGLTIPFRTTTKESRLPEYLSTFDAARSSRMRISR